MKKIILVGWEVLGYNTPGGKALSKRILTLATGLHRAGYSVSVISKNHFGEIVDVKNDNGFPVYLVPGVSNNPSIKIGFFRKIWTFFCVFFFGDQSGLWGIKTFFFIRKKNINLKETVVISFFTPRGPLLCGFLLRTFNGTNWIVDLQDNFDHGLGSRLVKVGKVWMRFVLKYADQVVHVSPEWSSRDGALLHRNIVTLRHALPKLPQILPKQLVPHKAVKIFYYGSLSYHQQHLFFFDYIAKTENTHFYYAGFESIDSWLRELKMGDKYEYLRWLEFKELFEYLNVIDFVVIFGWKEQNRQVVPSKVYELISMNVPMIVIGEDSGGLRSLEDQYDFKFLWAKNREEFELILSNPYSYRNDYKVFDSLNELNFVTQYISLIENLN